MTNANISGSGDSRTVGEKTNQEARGVSEDLKHRAQDMADNVATEAETYATRAKGAAADEVKGVASALRTAADELRSGSPQERTFSQIAEGLADASDAMRDKDLGELVGSLTGFARRNPMIFLGSAALIGFAATRFAKASSDPTPGSSPSQNQGASGHQMAQHSASARTDIAGTHRPQSPVTAPTTPGVPK